MATNLFSDKDWQKLLRNIERGKCVLMLGADIPSDTDNSPQLSLASLFAQKLGKQIASNEIFDANDLPHIAQSFLTNKIGRRRDDLEIEAETFYRDFQNHTTSLHQCLAQLPFSNCISITPDDLMSNAYKQAGKSPLEAFYHFHSNLPLTVTGNERSPLVYKLYGAITDSRSLVLTETDLLDFLANIIAGTPELPPVLTNIFNDKDTSFLFVGFGFQRWYLRVLLHLFRNQLNNTPPWSVALEDNRFFADPGHEQTALFYDSTHSIEFRHCSWHEFAQDLLKRYQERLLINQKPPEKPLPIDAPTVFLCHSSKHGEAVGQLGKKLRELGLNTWRDRDDLRGGDKWDDKIIHHVIEKSIDYFLVLQTPDMLAASESYFVKEINCALERQKQIWSEFVFVVPAFFSGDSSTILPVLSHLNYLDLRKDNDLTRLVINIQDDRQQRLARKELANAS